MSNMSYCRNENTAGDLLDVWENWHDTEDFDEREARGRARIIELARAIVRLEGEE